MSATFEITLVDAMAETYRIDIGDTPDITYDELIGILSDDECY